jgi:glycerate kinase
MHRKFLVCFDKFKGTLTAHEACECVASVLRASNHSVVELPLSDGGEGFVSCLERDMQLQRKTIRVRGPRGDDLIDATYGMAKNGKEKSLAVIEMSAASGLALLESKMRDPMHTTTFGTGQLVRDAIQNGATHILLGLGGSATNDAGLGALQALGVRITLKGGKVLSDYERDGEFFQGKHLIDVERIDVPDDVAKSKVHVILACDVRNPFVGPQGAVAVFSPQKGATKETMDVLERGMMNVASLLPINVSNVPGAGAAGGTAGGFLACFGDSAQIKSGAGRGGKVETYINSALLTTISSFSNKALFLMLLVLKISCQNATLSSQERDHLMRKVKEVKSSRMCRRLQRSCANQWSCFAEEKKQMMRQKLRRITI